MPGPGAVQGGAELSWGEPHVTIASERDFTRGLFFHFQASPGVLRPPGAKEGEGVTWAWLRGLSQVPLAPLAVAYRIRFAHQANGQ